MSGNNNIKNQKLSINECKKILSAEGKNYSDDEILSIRDLLYCFAQIDINTFHLLEKNEKKHIEAGNVSKGLSNNENTAKDAA